MITIKKAKNKDFVVLNLTDFQLSPGEWALTHKNGAIIDYTLKQLFEKVKPDLVTLSGDIAWCGDCEALELAACSLDRFGVPYALVWGNHDQDGGTEKLPASEEVLKKHPLFLYERGPEGLGFGNYLIAIEEEGKIVHSLIMMDSHDHARCFDSEGKEIFAWGNTPAWGKLYPEQIEWYCEQIKGLKEMGCPSSSLIMHIPCFAYREAFDSAFKPQPEKITIADSYKKEYWNEGFEGSFGVKYEGICSYPADDGVFDDFFSRGNPLDFTDCSLLSLQFLIYLEEMYHFVKNVVWELGDIRIGIVAGVIKGNSNNLFVGAIIINHRDNANRVATHHG